MLRQSINKLMLLAVFALLLTAATACGSAGSPATATEEDSTPVAQEVIVKATNFQFDHDVYTVKKGEPFRIKVSTEGIHGIQVANTEINLRAGQSMVYTMNNAGEYEIRCSIPCGVGHEKMKATLKVV